MKQRILYLSAGTQQEVFWEFQSKEYIKGGFQAQKFNYLVMSGLAVNAQVWSIANPPYSRLTPKLKKRGMTTDGVHYICLGNAKGKFHRLVNLRQMLGEAIKICKANHVTAVVSDAINPLASLTALIVCKMYKIPKIAIITDIPEFMDKGHETFFTKLTTFCMKKYDGYVFLTEAMNGNVNQKMKPYIVMEGLCEFGDIPQESIQPNSNVCLYTGSLAEGVGIDLLLEAFVQTDKKDAELRIYGNGKMKDKVIEMAKYDARIHYKGTVSNDVIIEEQKKASLLINPRPCNVVFGEYSFPSKIMEYMASGTPVLTTKLPGIPTDYFDYLFLIEEDSVRGIKEAIERFWSSDVDDRIRMGRNAQKFVLEHKNKIVQTKQILEMIKRIEW